MDNLEEMNTFLEKYNLPILHQEEIENMNKSVISDEIKRCLLPENKSYDKPRQHIKKQRHHFAELKAMVFPVVMYECESWTIKKTEH